MYRNVMLFSVIIIMLLTGCVNQSLSNENDEYLSNSENSCTEEEITFSQEDRETPEWQRINNNAELFLGKTGSEIAQIAEIMYVLFLDEREYLGNSDATVFYKFEDLDSSVWGQKCTAIYIEPRRILFGIYGLHYEGKEYSVEQITEYLGSDISWGIKSGHDYFQYAFEDITVRFFVDRDRGVLLEDSLALIETSSEG